MCSRPIKKDGVTFACRSCNDCIATRRHSWVARAMAEKTDHPHTLCLALTYSDETEEGRQGARMFCYADVRGFFARLRRSAAYLAKKHKLNIKPYIRFLVAGEQGDRNARCHWHIILYSNFDVLRVGEFKRMLGGQKVVVTERDQMLTVGKREVRMNWSLWPLGFVTAQEPDEGGMSYVLSYCLKDQFTGDKSRDTMREAKSENFATGLFRMSKRPAIGENFLMRKMEALEATGSVLPSLQIKIPEFAGYWQPNGSFRKKLLWCLNALNKRTVWATGANAPQWPSLLASLKDNPTDLEVLNGKITEKIDPKAASLKLAQSLERGAIWREEQAKRNSGQCYCQTCLDSLSEASLAEQGIVKLLTSSSRSEARYFLGDTVEESREIASYAVHCKFLPDGPTSFSGSDDW